MGALFRGDPWLIQDVDVLGAVDLEDVRSGRFVENDLNLRTIVYSLVRQESIRVQFFFVFPLLGSICAELT